MLDKRASSLMAKRGEIKSLFREEAVNAARVIEAAPLRIRNRFFQIGAIIALSTVLAVICYLFFGHYSPKHTVLGYTVAERGLARVYPPFRAVVLERYVEPGQEIGIDEPLYRLGVLRSTADTRDVGESLVANLQGRRQLLIDKHSVEERRTAFELEALAGRKRTLQQQIKAVEQEIDSRRQAGDLYKNELDRMKAMLDSGAIARSSFDKEKALMLERSAELSSLQRQLLELRTLLSEIDSSAEQQRLNAVQSKIGLEEEIASIDERIVNVKANKIAIVRSPITGIVSEAVYEPGQQVSLETSLASILPTGSSVQARLLVPSRAIGQVDEEQTVVLKYRAFPYQKYGSYTGTVKRVSRTPITSSETDLPVQITEPVYLVTVELDSQTVSINGKTLSLPTGMLLDADIVITKLRFYEWVLQPLNQLRESI